MSRRRRRGEDVGSRNTHPTGDLRDASFSDFGQGLEDPPPLGPESTHPTGFEFAVRFVEHRGEGSVYDYFIHKHRVAKLRNLDSRKPELPGVEGNPGRQRTKECRWLVRSLQAYSKRDASSGTRGDRYVFSPACFFRDTVIVFSPPDGPLRGSSRQHVLPRARCSVDTANSPSVPW